MLNKIRCNYKKHQKYLTNFTLIVIMAMYLDYEVYNMKGTVLGVICCIACAVMIPSEVFSMVNNPSQTVVIGEHHESSMSNVATAIENIEQALQSLESLKTALQTSGIKADGILTINTAQAFELVKIRLTNSKNTLVNIYSALEKYQSIPADEINKCERNATGLIDAFKKLDEALVKYQKLIKNSMLINKFTSTVLRDRLALLNNVETILNNIGVDSYIPTLLSTTDSEIHVFDKTSENIKLNQKGKKKWRFFNKKAQ